MFFVVRDGVYHPVEAHDVPALHAPRGSAGEPATLRDWEIHLSTVFPEVRLKRTIELRGADAGPMPMAAALGALWRGLLDDRGARAAAWALVAGRSFDGARGAAAGGAAGGAARARFGGRPPAASWRWSCVRIADAGLARLPGGEEDRPLLDPLRAYATAGRSPADDLLDDYEAAGAIRRSWSSAGSCGLDGGALTASP